MPQLSIEEAIKEIRLGKMVVLVDDEHRENEGDLTMAAEKVSPETVNFMARYGRGLVSLSLTEEKIRSLDLPMMVEHNTSPFQTGFTVSIEARFGVTTGISAADRATTILTAIADNARPYDLVRPGHVFPLKAKKGGVMIRAGQTEGSVDLARLAGLKPAGVICGIMDDDGSMARMPALEKFSDTHGIGICTVADLIEYRMRTESFVKKSADAVIPTAVAGNFRIMVFENEVENLQHIALVKGDIDSGKPILVRVHSECLTGEIFGSSRCDCGEKLQKAMEMIENEGSGVLLYIRQEGRGIGLINKVKAYAMMDKGTEEIDVKKLIHLGLDMRHYGLGAQVLVQLGVKKMKLLTNNPKRMIGLQGYGLSIIDHIPIDTRLDVNDPCYLECRQLKKGAVLNKNNQS